MLNSLYLALMKSVKKLVYIIWIGIILALLTLFIVSPSSFAPEAIAQFLDNYQAHLILAYALMSFVRGFFLIPSTPFILAGIILFPTQLWTVFIISIIGVWVGSTVVYYFADFLGFSEKLERKFPEKIETWHRRLNSPKAMLIVIAWSFFPLVPTDVICYVAGIVKMPYRYLILGVLIGEVVLIYFYVFYGTGLIELIKEAVI